MGPFVVLTRDNIDLVMIKTGKSKEELLKILDDYEKDGLFKVKVPLLVRNRFNFPSL